MVELNTESFTTEQQQYLAGFVSGILQGRNIPFLGQDEERRFTDNPEESVHGTPIDDLCREELIKYKQNGLDCYPAMLQNAEKNIFPDSDDVFHHKFHGLFHVAPAREVWKAIPFTKIPALLEKLLAYYLATRIPEETFISFTNRQPLEELVALNS